MKPRIPILFCIDIEPEERRIPAGAQPDWVGFEKTFEFFQELRSRLANITGAPAHFSWFLRMDPQIADTYGSPDWVVTRYPQLITELEVAGDELGLHSHAWRWEAQTNDWIADFSNPEWIDHCIRSSFNAFHQAMNRQCRSFRFGDHWTSERTLDLLEELGAQFDLTLEPGQAVHTFLPGERFTGSFPDCRQAAQRPYQPSKTNFTKPGLTRKRNLWMFPVSAEQPHLGAVTKRSWPMGLAVASRTAQPYVTLNLAFSREVFSSIMERLLTRLTKPFLVIVARTDVAVVPNQRANLLDNIDYLLSHHLAERFIFETPGEAINRLRFNPLQWWKKR